MLMHDITQVVAVEILVRATLVVVSLLGLQLLRPAISHPQPPQLAGLTVSETDPAAFSAGNILLPGQASRQLTCSHRVHHVWLMQQSALESAP